MGEEEFQDDQKELFNYHSPLAQAERQAAARSDSGREKISFQIGLDLLLAIILFAVVACIFAYLLGVHQGKKATSKVKTETLTAVTLAEEKESASSPAGLGETPIATEPAREVSSQATSSEESSREAPSGISSAEPAAVEKPLLPVTGKFWTVQLVTYKSERLAQQEIERLKSKGIESFILTSGKYFLVCAGRFETKQDAKTLLSKLRIGKNYKDAYVRQVNR